MGKNKNAIIRYQVLDRCFRNPGRIYYMTDLVEACNEALRDVDPGSDGVRRRQLYEDIKFMRDSMGYNAPIETYRDGRKVYYRYSDPNFSINNQPLNEMEAQQLKESIATLTRFKGLPQFEWVEEIKVRLEQSFNLKSEEKVISFDENPYLEGLDYIGDIYNAIVHKRVLKIDYRPFKSDHNSLHFIHPYFLKQYNNRWFLFGYNEGLDTLSNFALDRIKSLGESDRPYRANDQYDFEEFFEDTVGVSVHPEEELQTIKIRIEPSLWPYVKTKPIHGSQKVLDRGEEAVVIQLQIIPNYEFYAQMLSHGDGIEILEPASVREKMRNTVTRMFEKYNCAD